MYRSIKNLRMTITDKQLKEIMVRLGVDVVRENEREIIFPTRCHNIEGGSPKLYYYKDEKIFKCYTRCPKQFDIFEMILKVHKLKDIQMTLPEAIAFTGLDNTSRQNKSILEDFKNLTVWNSQSKLQNTENNENTFGILNKNLLFLYQFDRFGCSPWLAEGISEETMRKFYIGYNSYVNAITIPNLDHEGNLVGIRGRFMNPDSKYKYMPIKHNGEFLSHPTGKFLYGFYENKKNIERLKVAVIFEGEKSVLKMEDFYPGNNFALATTGKKVTFDHLSALLTLGNIEVVLAYDRDYTTTDEMTEKLKEYSQITNILKGYFNVSVIMDYEKRLGLNDSPADCGKEIFDELFKRRIRLR